MELVVGLGDGRWRQHRVLPTLLGPVAGALAADIREVYAEAKGDGFDAKTMRQVVRLRKLESAERQEQEALLDLYKAALGLGG